MNGETSLWRGEFTCHSFEFEGRRAIVVRPRRADSAGRWLLKTECFDAFQDLECEMVKRGFHLAYLENRCRWVAGDDLEAKRRFRDYIIEEFGLNVRCIPVGMSCGGLHAIRQAARYPEMVSTLYLDAPVVNLLSCPFGMGSGVGKSEAAQREALAALNISRSELIAYRDHPLDHIPELIRNRVPLLLVCGDADQVVSPEENVLLVRDAYARTDIPFLFMCKPGCGHHPHGPAPEAMSQAVDFLCGLPA